MECMMTLAQLNTAVKEFLRFLVKGSPHRRWPDLTLSYKPSMDAARGKVITYQYPGRYYEGWSAHVGKYVLDIDPMTVVETEAWLKYYLDRRPDLCDIIIP